MEQVAREIGEAMEGYAVVVDKSMVPIGNGEKGFSLDTGGACQTFCGHPIRSGIQS
jgi:hypothetical protein